MPEQAQALTPRPQEISAYTWYVLGLLFLVNVVNYMDRLALAMLMPLIKVDLQLSDAQLGLLVGLAFAVFYAVCGIPIARLADRGQRRNVIAVCLAVWSGATALSGAAQNFLHLFLARIGVGAGEAGSIPPAQSIICDYVPETKRPGFFAMHHFGLIVGSMVGLIAAGALGEALGWRMAFLMLGAPGLALALLLWLTLREPERGRFDQASAPEPTLAFREVLASLWRIKTYELFAVGGILNGFIQYGLIQWWPTLYVRVFGISPASVGVMLGVALALGSGLGLLAGGYLGNSFAGRDRRVPLKIAAITNALATMPVAASLFVGSAYLSIALVGFAAFLWSLQNGPGNAAIYGLMNTRQRATAGAILIFLGSVLGYGFGPLVVGALSDELASSFAGDALRFAMLVPTALLPLAGLYLYRVAMSVPVEPAPPPIQVAQHSNLASPGRTYVS